jgi:hypothetical protein
MEWMIDNQHHPHRSYFRGSAGDHFRQLETGDDVSLAVMKWVIARRTRERAA